MTGREQERAAVVGWLRSPDIFLLDSERHALKLAAEAIEAFYHLTDRPAP